MNVANGMVCQAYAVCMFVWKFIVPLIIYIVTFWKIMAVIRRQAKVKNANRRKVVPQLVDETTAPPTSAAADAASISHLGQRKKKVRSGGHRQSTGHNTGVSQTEINVIKTIKTGELISMLFLMQSHVGPRNHVSV